MKIMKTAFILVCFIIFLPVNNAIAQEGKNPDSNFFNRLFRQPQKQQVSGTEKPAPQKKSPGTAGYPLKKQVVCAGYSQAFMPVKELIVSGMVKEAAEIYAEKNEQVEHTSNSGDRSENPAKIMRSDLGPDILRKGMRGPKVVELQKCLKAKGFGSGSIDGVFGPATESAVKEFQRSNGLEADGVVGPSVWIPLHDKSEANQALDSKLPDKTMASLLNPKALAYLEGGTLAIDCGDFEEAVDRFAYAEDLLAQREKEPKVWDWLKKGTTFTGETLSGDEELQPFKGEGYERVLMLNYKSIAYLLQGKRKAYNVTRRAINWQNIEKKRFERKLRDAEEKLSKEKEEKTEKENDAVELNIRETVDKEYVSMEAKAVTVPNAYVNPFGYYVVGMIQEFESFDDLSLRDNARISYKKALDLNPESEVLQQAVKDLENSFAPPHKRLVHVVVADGFVPEKKVLILPLSIKETVIPIKLPIYQPVPSQVHRIEVDDGKDKRLATLSAVADIEAICLRHQKDSAPFRYLRVLLATGRSYLTTKILSPLGSIGKATSNVIVNMATPDMRSWMSLPATIQAARFYVPQNLGKIRIRTYDKNGRMLASKSVILDTSCHNFVYARSLNNTLYTHANQKMWLTLN